MLFCVWPLLKSNLQSTTTKMFFACHTFVIVSDLKPFWTSPMEQNQGLMWASAPLTAAVVPENLEWFFSSGLKRLEQQLETFGSQMKLINITTAKFEGHTLLCDVIGCERGMSPSARGGGVLGCCWETKLKAH